MPETDLRYATGSNPILIGSHYKAGWLHMRSYFAVTACLVICAVSVCAQTADELSVLPSKLDEPPAVIPAECPASLAVASGQLSGSESYVRLTRILRTMELGHDASAQWMSSLSPSSSDVGAALLHLNMQLSSALNNYLCASFLTGKMNTGEPGSSEEIAVHTLTSVFNRMALETIQLRSQMKAAAQQSESGKQGLSVSTADELSKILQDRKDAGTDLQNVMMIVALMTVDTSDKTATKTDTVSMSAKERIDLLKRATALASATPVDEFTRGAKVLQELLTTHTKTKG